MITFKRLAGLSLVGLIYLSQQESFVRASVDPIERAERSPTSVHLAAGSTEGPALSRGQTYAAHSGSLGASAIARTSQGSSEIEVRDAAEKVKALSASLEAKLPQSEKSQAIRHYLALSMAGVDVAADPELSQAQALSHLVQDPVAAADEVRGILEGSSNLTQEERIAVVRMNDNLTGHEFSLPIVERTLQAEATRKFGSADSAESLDAEVQRIQVVTESYFRHVTDSEQRMSFLKAVRDAHTDARISQMLDSRFVHLTQPVQSPSNANGDAEAIAAAQQTETIQAMEQPSAPMPAAAEAPVFINSGESNFAPSEDAPRS